MYHSYATDKKGNKSRQSKNLCSLLKVAADDGTSDKQSQVGEKNKL